VSSIVYWALCKLSPIPATRDSWMEVGDEVDDFTAAYDTPDSRSARDEEEYMAKDEPTKSPAHNVSVMD
jgi:NCS1 family nucleobase:cation symporter-1